MKGSVQRSLGKHDVNLVQSCSWHVFLSNKEPKDLFKTVEKNVSNETSLAFTQCIIVELL